MRRPAAPSQQPAVLYDKRAGIAEILLNRPETLNAYDTAMRDGLYEALTAVRDDPEVRVVLLFGNGRAFSSGGDLREFGSAPSPVAARSIRWQRDVWGTLLDLAQPVVAGVHGAVVGGGFEMAMLCDLCIAARDARFALPETGLGMIPGVAGTQTLPRLIGTAAARALVLGGGVVDARRARALGLVQDVVAPEALRERARSLAEGIARTPTPLLAALKRLVRDAAEQPLAAGLAAERRASAVWS